MPPHPPGHYPAHPHDLGLPHEPHPRWIVNDERIRRLGEAGAILVKIGELLSSQGRVQFDGTEITPSAEPVMVIRYERTPKGELCLKLELRWVEEYGSERRASEDLAIG